MRRGVVIVAAALLVALGAPAAKGCSCAPVEPRSALARADGAFVGALVQPPDEDDADDRGNLPWEFRVERAVKGTMAETVTVWGGPDGNTCGIGAEVGRRMGLFLHLDDRGRWTGGLCSEVDPDELLRATQPLPAPDGEGSTAFVVGGTLGDVGVLSLDEQRRTIAYGKVDGELRAAAVCPGGTRMAEVVLREPDHAVVTVRDLPSLEPVWRAEPARQSDWPRSVGCGNQEGTEVYVVLQTVEGDRPGGALLRVRRGEPPSRIWSGTGAVDAFDPAGRFVLLAETRPPALVRVELPSGQARRVAAFDEAVETMAVDPTGTQVATVGATYVDGEFRPPRLAVLGADGGPGHERALDGVESVRALAWASKDLVTVARTGEHGDIAETFDARVQPRARWAAWPLVSMTARQGRLYGVGYDGVIREADPVAGGPVAVRELPGRHLFHVAAVPPLPSRKPTPTTTQPPTSTTSTTSTTTQPPPTTTTSTTEALAVQPTSSDRDPPGAVGGLAALALLAASGATALVARRSVRRSGLPAAHGAVR